MTDKKKLKILQEIIDLKDKVQLSDQESLVLANYFNGYGDPEGILKMLQDIDDPQATEDDWDEAYEKYYDPEEKEVNGYF